MVTVYSSLDASAPVLSGSAAALITVLDAVLVNGYGAKPAAGWTKAFSGASKAAYRQAVATGFSQFYLRILDDGSITGADDAYARGFETMSDVDTGTGPFPTVAQMTNGLDLIKSNTTDATARPWVILADGRTAIMFFDRGTSETSTATGTFFYFGDIVSHLLLDAYKCAIFGGTGAAFIAETLMASGSTTAQARHYMPRSYTGAGASIGFAKHGNYAFSAGAGIDGNAAGLRWPNGPDGGIYLSRISVIETTNHIRGYLRGLYSLLNAANEGVRRHYTFDGVGEFVGRSFYILKNTQTGGDLVLVVETTPWDESA